MWRTGCLIAFSVIWLSGVSHADAIFTFSAGPGTSLNATQSFYGEVLPGNLPPQVAPPNYDLVSISVIFDPLSVPCTPIDPSMPAVCQITINDIVQLGGVDGTSGGAVVQFDAYFQNCPGCNDFDGYFTACTFGGGGLSSSPDVQCYLPAGIYSVTLSIDEHVSPVTNAASIPPGTATLTASIGGLVPVPEPSTSLPCLLLMLLMIGGRAARKRACDRAHNQREGAADVPERDSRPS